jgi:hypothetical protein
MSQLIRSWAAGLGMAVVLAAVPAAIATIQPTAVSNADVCAAAGGRHVDVGGCTNGVHPAAVGVAVAADDDAAAQVAAGQPPCFTPAGVPYYTPGDAPCT